MISKTLYTAEVTSTGGRAGHVQSSDGLLSVNLVPPAVLGGKDGAGTNPEQMFAGGYAACFAGALSFVAGQKKIHTGEVTIHSKVQIGPSDTGKGFELAVDLDVTVAAVDQATAETLVDEAHQVCPYSNATRGNIPVTLHAHGGK